MKYHVYGPSEPRTRYQSLLMCVAGTTLKARTACTFSVLTSPESPTRDELESFLPILVYYSELICLLPF